MKYESRGGIYYFDESLIDLARFKKLRHPKRISYLHREDGPAFESLNRDMANLWVQKGLLHRLDGPALYRKNGLFETYYIFGRYLWDRKMFLEHVKFFEENDEIAYKLWVNDK